MGKFFELKATLFILVLFILSVLMGLSAGIGIGLDAAQKNQVDQPGILFSSGRVACMWDYEME